MKRVLASNAYIKAAVMPSSLRTYLLCMTTSIPACQMVANVAVLQVTRAGNAAQIDCSANIRNNYAPTEG